MTYARVISRYLLLVATAFPLVMLLWGEYRLREISALGAGVTLREYVAPSWHRLARRVRAGEVLLTREEQAARLDRVAAFFDSEGRNEQQASAQEIDRAKFLFRASVGVLLTQILFAVGLGVRAVLDVRPAPAPPPN